MDIKNLIKSNKIYVAFFLLYFLIALAVFGFTWYGFLIVTLAYAVSITIALSSAGENLLRFLQGVRRISTQQEKEYILPLFHEVYSRAKETTPTLSDNIELFITDEMHVNAYAFGRNTVVVTRGLIESMEEEQVMGIMAHEFGHIVNGHTIMLLLTLIGNGIFSVVILSLKICMFFLEALFNGMDESGSGNFMSIITHYILEWSVMAFMYIGTTVLMINSRKNEFQADAYASQIGFGDGLLQGLYMLQHMSMGRNKSIIERLTASHPELAYRIERLENCNTKELASH